MHSTRTRTRARYLALLTTVSLLSPAVAAAGPDDGKVLGTAEHIDAPKVFWQNNTFDLRMKETTPLQDAVLWVGRGHDDFSGGQHYQYELPANGTMSDVGKPGEVFYTAPANPGWNHLPIWWGYGADAGLPTSDFKHETASLDLLSVEGPGDVEFFVDYRPDVGPERLLGTLPGSPKSIRLSEGMHVHNSTLFTKPGRYVLTYRTSARDHEGNIIASAPQQLAVQVGGRSPLGEKTVSTKERFDAAPTGDTAGYRVSVAPKDAADKSEAKPGDEHLHTISFEAPGAGDGTLTLFNEGYFLSDIPVVAGKATWDEMFGPLGGNLQAVFTPAAGAKGARWVSQPLTVQPGKEATASDAAATWVDKTGTARTLQGTGERGIGSDDVNVRLERVEDTVMKLSVDTDPNFTGFVKGGLYEGGSDVASHDISASVIDGHGEVRLPYSDWMKGAAVKLSVLPHPLVKAGRADMTLTESLDITEPVAGKGRLVEAASASAVKSAPQRCGDRLVLDRGHIDLKATHDGDLGLVLKDETGVHAPGVVERALSEVQINVGDNAQVVRENAYADPALDFAGPVGERFYLLPQTQKRDIIWPGYNTQDLDYSQFDGTVDLNIEPRSIPEGASFGLFQVGSLGEADVMLDSTAKDFVLETDYAAHAHSNWVFSKPGVYELEVRYTAKDKSGKAIESAPQVLRVAVGDAAVKDCAVAATSSAVPTSSAAPTSTAVTSTVEPSLTVTPTTAVPTSVAEPSTAAPSSAAAPTTPTLAPAEKGSAASPWAWLAPLLGVGLIGALFAAAKNVPAVKKMLETWGIWV